MAVTLTYDDTLARVRITATSLAAADYATVERSTDQIVWTTVRGATNVAVTAGAFTSTLDDYEFTPGVVNYYRVRGVETGAITFVDRGNTVFGVNASVTPPFPPGILDGDLLVAFASIRNSGAGTVNVPAGWTLIRQAGNISLLGRRYVTGDVAPTITFSGGVANADTIGKIAAFRRADLTPVTGVDQLNASAQDIAYPALTVPANNLAILDVAWKQDDATSIGGRASGGFTGIGAIQSTITGDDASQYWLYQIQTTATNLPGGGSHTVVGGAAAISRAMTVAFQHAPYLNQQTATITPVLTQVWLKSISRPFLNRPVTVVAGPNIPTTWPARTGVSDVINRTLPVAVNDIRGSARRTLMLRTETADDAQTLEYIIESGDVLLVQAPAGCRHPRTAYVTVGDVSSDQHPLRLNRVTWTLPTTEVAAPGPYVVPATSTWATVLATYATWSDLLAANPTWADLLARIGPPSSVIVP